MKVYAVTSEDHRAAQALCDALWSFDRASYAVATWGGAFSLYFTVDASCGVITISQDPGGWLAWLNDEPLSHYRETPAAVFDSLTKTLKQERAKWRSTDAPDHPSGITTSVSQTPETPKDPQSASGDQRVSV